MKKKLVDHAVATKIENLKKGLYHHLLYDKIVFKKMREVFGGRVRLLGFNLKILS